MNKYNNVYFEKDQLLDESAAAIGGIIAAYAAVIGGGLLASKIKKNINEKKMKTFLTKKLTNPTDRELKKFSSSITSKQVTADYILNKVGSNATSEDKNLLGTNNVACSVVESKSGDIIACGVHFRNDRNDSYFLKFFTKDYDNNEKIYFFIKARLEYELGVIGSGINTIIGSKAMEAIEKDEKYLNNRSSRAYHMNIDKSEYNEELERFSKIEALLKGLSINNFELANIEEQRNDLYFESIYNAKDNVEYSDRNINNIINSISKNLKKINFAESYDIKKGSDESYDRTRSYHVFYLYGSGEYKNFKIRIDLEKFALASRPNIENIYIFIIHRLVRPKNESNIFSECRFLNETIDF